MPRRKTLSDHDLLDQLAPVLLRLGMHRATLAALGRAVGLSPATLLQRFGSRVGVIEAVIDRLTDQLEAELASELPATPNPAGELIDWLTSRAAILGDRAMLAGSLEVLGRDFALPERRVQAARHQRLVRSRIQRSLAATGVGLPQQEALAPVFEAHWHGLVIQWGLSGRGTLEDHVRSGLRVLWAQLFSKPPSTSA